MALKAGRVGVSPDQVDEFGKISSDATGAYTKQEADAKFETQSHASSTYETKTEAAALQPKTLAVPISMLIGSQLVPKNTVEEVIATMNEGMTNKDLTDSVFKKRTLSSSDDLDDIVESGIYGISTSPAHIPENQSYCTLIVNTNAGGGVNQIIFRNNPTEAFIYERRYGGEPLTWSSWFKFSGTIVS